MALATAAALALACGKEADPAVVIRSVQPAQGPEGAAVAIRIEGEGLDPHVLTDYGDPGASVVDARFEAWLGTRRLRDVRPSGDGALLATVPEDLPAGTYDLAVSDPAGKRAALAAAYRVVAPGDAEALVASFRLDPIAAQVAKAPFAITVTALDAAGQPVTGFSGTVALSDRTGALVPASIGPFAWGAWTGPVEVRAPDGADALTVTDGAGHSGTSAAFAVLPAPAARVAFTSVPVDALAGACAGPVTVALEDLYGAPTSATAPVAVAVAGGAAVYADPACAVAAPGATIAAGATSASVYVRSTLAAPFTLDATAPGLGPGVQDGLVRPAPAVQLVFATAPQTLVAGTCSGAATLLAQDAFGNASPPAADTAVALSSTAAAGLSFHAAAGCGDAPVAAVTLPASASTTAFWFRATAAETLTVTAAGAGIAGAGAQGETIVPAAPASLVFVTAPQAVAAGSCSGVATVEARDAYGNVSPVPAGTLVSLAASPAAGFEFHLDPACGDAPASAAPLAPGATTASFRFRATATGTYGVTAAGAGLPAPAAQPETILPAAPERLVFTTAPKTATAGQCSGPLTVEVRDGLGNSAPVAAATPVSLAAAPATGTVFYASPDCTGPSGGPASAPAGSATATFSFLSTAAGAFDATATAAALLAATQAETVLAAAPDRLVFTSPAQAVAAGDCSGAVTVEAQDAYGNPSPVPSRTAVALGAVPGAGFQLYGRAGCGGGAVASVDIAARATTATFWFGGTLAGPVTVTAAAAGLPTPASQVETIGPAAPVQLVFTTAPQTRAAGACSSAATVEARDAYGNVAPVAAATAVALSAAPGAGFQLFDAAGCGGAPVASVDLPAGASAATFWFRGTAAGTVSVGATAAGIAGAATQAETIVAAAPDRLVFTTSPQSLAAGTCSGAAMVEARDAYGNVAPVATPTSVALSASPPAGFAFFDAAGCGGAPAGSASVAAGASSATFWFRGTLAGPVTVTAAAAGIPTAATQLEAIAPAAPERLVFTSPAQAVTAGACSAPATLEARDAYGNVAPVAALTSVALSALPPGGFQLFDASGCGGAAVGAVSIAAGAPGASFWFRGTVAGAVAVTAAGAGIPTPASQTETVSPDVPDHLVFASPPQTVSAGGCSAAATLEARDAYGNAAPVAALTSVALSALPSAGFQLFGAAGCGAAPVTSIAIAGGASATAFWFRGTLAGAVTVAATGAGIPAPATQAETIDPAEPDRLVFSSPPGTVTAGACSAAATVEARDVYDNVARVAGPTAVSLSAAPPAGFQLFDAGGCGGAPLTSVSIPAGGSSAGFRFRGTAAGAVVVTASGAGIPGAATQLELVDPAAPAAVAFTSDPQVLKAGSCSATARIELRDAFGNATADPGAAIGLALAAAPGAGLELFEDPGCAVSVPGAGIAIASGSAGKDFWFRGTLATTVTLASSPAGLVGASQVEIVDPAAATRIAYASAPATAVAGACSGAVAVVAQDEFGNVAPVAGATTVALSAAPAAGFELHPASGCGGAPVGSTVIAAGGTTGAFRFRGTVARAVTVTASAFGTSADQAETILPAAPDRLVFTSAPQSVTAGACSAPATLEARDAYGNIAPVAALTSVALSGAPAAGFELFDAAGCGGAPVASLGVAAGGSGTTFWFRGTASGPVTVTAAGAGIPTPATQIEDVNPAAPDRLVFTTAAQTVTAGLCSGLVTVESRDAYGNVAPVGAATAVTLSAAPASGFELFDAAGCGVTPIASVGLGAGASTASFRFRGTVSGSVTVTASATGIPTAATQAETLVPAAPERLVFTTPAQTVTAGSCSAIATVEARDGYGNVAPVAALAAVSLSAAPAAGFQLFGAAGCGGPPVASVDIPAGGSSASFWFQGTAAGSVTATASGAGIPAAAAQAETVNPAVPDRLVFTTSAQTLAAGSCSAQATVETRDAFGNPSPVAALTAVTLAAAPPTGFAFHDAAGCGGAPVTSTSMAARATTATFWMRATAVGAVTVTATGAGIPTPATQPETISPGPTDHFAFDPVMPTWIRTWSYAVRVRALDAFGNPTPAFTDTATLSVTVPQPPNGAGATLSCTAGCGSGTVTAPFVAGAWTGSVAIGWTDPDPQKLGVGVRAVGAGASSTVTGSSSVFDVIGAVRSPPKGRITASPVVVFAGQPVAFDASGSSDYQTPAASLEVSWDFQGQSSAVPAYPAPAAPWTPWTLAQTASNTYSVAGTYTARVAVRDGDGDVGFGSVTVVVLPVGAALCVVTTSADVDDGATACSGGTLGPDGQLSLAEALRVAPNLATITFAAPMTISGTGAFTVARDDITIVAPAGTLLDGKTITVSPGNRARLVGLELAHQTAPVTVGNRKTVTLEDCYLHEMPGITDYGTLTLTRVRMSSCIGQCVYVTDSTNSDTLTIRHSTFLGGPGAVGVDIAQCKAGKLALESQSNVFAGLATAIRLGTLCTGYTSIRHDTFASNGTGISYPAVASASHVLRNTIFSGHATAAASCGLATFASRDRHLLYQNASDGCLGGDAGTLAGDPAYLFAPAGDYRVGLASPAVDSALDLGLFLVPQYPATAPPFLGAGPDRGGRESW